MQASWNYTLLQGANGSRARVTVRDADTGETLSLQGKLRLRDGECYFVAADMEDLPARGYAELVLFADGGVVRGNAATFLYSPGILRLLPSGPVELIQRRLFYRARIEHPIRLQPALHPIKTDYWQGRLLDLSLGGARVVCGLEVSPGSLVKVILPDTPAGDLVLHGQVRIVATGQGPEWTAGLQWVRLGVEDRERLEDAVLAALTGRWGPGVRPIPRCSGPAAARAELARQNLIDLAGILLKAQHDVRALYEAFWITGMTIEELRALISLLEGNGQNGGNLTQPFERARITG